MDSKAKKLIKKIPIQKLPIKRDRLLLPSMALKRVTSKKGNGVYASADLLFKGAVFGRDSFEIAEDLMLIRPKLVRTILLSMVKLQGKVANNINEEQPGKIVHEYRNVIIDGKPINEESMAIFHNLASKWGGNDKEMAYYGSIDSTPFFLRVLGNYCSLYGAGILDEAVVHKDQNKLTVKKAAREAVKWLIRQLDDSKSGLLAYNSLNPEGIKNQVWKDSDEFYVHENGSLADHTKPIVSIEVQALAYDGLISAAQIFPEESAYYYEKAKKLRDKTFELLWLKKQDYFALGADYDSKDKLRLVTTPSANPATLLDSGFFDGLEPLVRQQYVSAIVEKIMSYEFLTDAGIRSRSLLAAGLINHWDYHGSFVSWPKETYDVAKGLSRQGFPLLAKQLENRLLNVILKHRQYPEFVYVDGWGRVLSSTPSFHSHGDVTIVFGTNNPERIQGWTVSAIMAIVSQRVSGTFSRDEGVFTDQWQADLEQSVLSAIPKVQRHLNPFKLSAKYPTNRYRLHK